jgi:hypothetical protein
VKISFSKKNVSLLLKTELIANKQLTKTSVILLYII